jgi:four helix bundle protein
MTIERFEDMEIWQEAREICKIVFKITEDEPFSKDYKFKNQIRSSGGSIMDNIAEGFGRGGNKEFISFLSIAKGSTEELRSQTYRAYDFKYIDKEVFNDLLNRTVKQTRKITNFITYLKNSERKGPKFENIKENK